MFVDSAWSSLDIVVLRLFLVFGFAVAVCVCFVAVVGGWPCSDLCVSAAFCLVLLVLLVLTFVLRCKFG